MSEQGQPLEGIAQIRQGQVTMRATGSEFFEPYFLGTLAEATNRAGQADEALAILSEALAAAEKAPSSPAPDRRRQGPWLR